MTEAASKPAEETARTSPQGAGRYLLGSSVAEIQHLVEQAEVYEDEAHQLLDRIGLKPGMDAVDIGCGVLGILAVLRQRVGDKGRVVGVDRQPRMLEMARTLADQRGLAIELVEADATQTALPRDSFDLVHCRTILLNVNNPEEILSEMVALARSGGVVAVQEPDSAGWVCDPPHPGWDILRAELTSAYRRNGKDFDIGRRVGRLLREAGLNNVQVRSTARTTRAGEFYQTFLLALTSLLRDDIIAGHSLTHDQFDHYSRSLRAHLELPDTITNQPIMWQAWGYKG